MKKNLFLLFGLVFILFTGCDNSKIPFGYVTGRITIDGKPAPENVIIRFVPQEPGTSPSIGFTDANGYYEMEFSLTRKGVEAGPSKVTFDNPETGKAVIPANALKANNKESWAKTIEVKKGRQKFDFNIDTSLKTDEKPTPTRRGARKSNTNEVNDADELTP